MRAHLLFENYKRKPARNKNVKLVYAGSSSKHSGRFKNPYTFSKDLGEDIIKLYETHCISNWIDQRSQERIRRAENKIWQRLKILPLIPQVM